MEMEVVSDNLDLIPTTLRLPYGKHEDGNEIEDNFRLPDRAEIKRVFYPVEFYYDSQDHLKIPSLTYLCCEKITRSTDLLQQVLPHLSVSVYYPLFAAALFNKCDKSARVLMSNWPFKTFSGVQVISEFVNNKKSDSVYNVGHIFWNVVDIFMETLKNRTTPHLRILDLHGLPIGDILIRLLIEYADDLDDKTLTNDYHVIIDCAFLYIGTTPMFMLNHLIMTRETTKIKIKLHINKVEIYRKYTHPTLKHWELLSELNPDELIGLSMPVDTLTMEQLFILKRFTSLVAFESTGKYFPLQLFPRLRRLALHPDTLSHFAESSVSENLEFLDISYLPPKPINASVLRRLISLQFNLVELNLGGQRMVEENLNLWITFLQKLAPSLKILQMEYCVKDEKLIPRLVNGLLSLVNLQYLNLGRNKMTASMLRNDVTKFLVLPKLECIQLNAVALVRQEMYSPHPRYMHEACKDIELAFKNKTFPTLVRWTFY